MEIRYIRIVLTPTGGPFHELDAVIDRTPGVAREQLAYIDLLQDESILLLYRLGTDRSVHDLDAVLSTPDCVRSSRVASGDGGQYALFHVDPAEPLRTLLSIADEQALVVEHPIEFTDDGSMLVTVAGTEAALRRGVAAVPESVGVRIERVGDYRPTDGADSLLTPRQREAIQVAAELGYYEEPRETTYEEIADLLGCTSSTANSLLRRAEARLVEAYLSGWQADAHSSPSG
jgi:DNA-binding CsgD family transcriptional regulator